MSPTCMIGQKPWLVPLSWGPSNNWSLGFNLGHGFKCAKQLGIFGTLVVAFMNSQREEKKDKSEQLGVAEGGDIKAKSGELA